MSAIYKGEKLHSTAKQAFDLKPSFVTRCFFLFSVKSEIHVHNNIKTPIEDSYTCLCFKIIII